MRVEDWSDQEKKSVGCYLEGNSYHSERFRLLYVAVPKVGCTTLKNWFARIEGYSKKLLSFTDFPDSDPDSVVHYLRMIAPTITGLPLSDIAPILESDSYFKFALVRNPYKRIFSAWQSKILLEEPLHIRPYRESNFYHLPINTADDIAKAFESFLEHLAENEAPSYWDYHWTPQVDLLRPDLITYTCLTKIEESESLSEKLRDWLDVSLPRPFEDRRLNESLIPYAPEFVTERSAALICSMYDRDFSVFGYEKILPAFEKSFSSEKCDLAIKAIKVIRGRHRRLGERNEKIFRLNEALNERDERISQLNAHLIRRSPLFDSDYYTKKYLDFSGTKVDAAQHYLHFGWKECKDPSLTFSTRFYLANNPDVANAGINPLLHYILYGQAEGRHIKGMNDNLKFSDNVCTSFTGYGVSGSRIEYTKIEGAAEGFEIGSQGAEPNLEQERIEAEIEAIRKSGLFDVAYYQAMYPEIQPPPADSIRHYCENGWREGRNPSDDFNTLGYLKAYSDVNNAGINPFWHYVIYGKAELRASNPSFKIFYEDDIYFGVPTTDIRLIAYYSNPDWGSVRYSRIAFKQAGQALMPHEELGFYSVSKPGTLTKQAQMARRHGVSAWCFSLDAAEGPSSQDTLSVFMSTQNINIEFIVDVDLRSLHVDGQMLNCLKNALADKRYLKIDGRPVLVMALPDDNLHCDQVLKAFDSLFNRAPKPYLIARGARLFRDVVETAIRFEFEGVLDFPYSPILEETWNFRALHKNGVNSVPYSVVVSQSIARMEANDDHRVHCYRTVTLGRDDSPIRPNDPLRYTRFSLNEYRRFLDAVILNARIKFCFDQRLLFINSWNDWNQGAVLEPDDFTGFSKLNETSRALLGLPQGLFLPKVTVIVLNRNHADYLQHRLESIYNQTYKNIEVLLLDDCSVDQSQEILLEYGNRYPDITQILFNQKNSGCEFRQWAKGIKAATGDLIWIAKSDDYCDDNFLEKMVCCFEDEAVMLAYSRTEFVRADESPMTDEFWHRVRDLDCRDKWKHSYVKTAHQEVSEALGFINTVFKASSAIFRRPLDMPLLDDEAWLSMQVVGDWVFYLHQLRCGKIAYSAETTSYCRMCEESQAEKMYKSESFYRELSFAARTVQSIFDTPYSVIEKFCHKVREYYDSHCGKSDAELRCWFNEKEILDARYLRSPNIAVSTMGFFPGGAEILPIRMANELKRQGYSVVLLSSGYGEYNDRVRKLLRRDIPLVSLSDIEFIKAFIHDFGIEVLNSHQWEVQKYPIQVPDVFGGLKAHVASLHGYIENDNYVNKEQLRIANESVTTWVYTADKNLSPFIEHGLYESNSKRFTKIPNGMAPPEIKPICRAEIGIPDHAFVLCCVSRAIPEKGWAETIEAVRHARKLTGRDIRLILVGNGPVYDEYVDKGTPSFVYLAGFSEKSVGFYATADMGIMLTKFKSESFPLTILDCLFAGKPFISTEIGEIRNMLTTDRGCAGKVFALENWVIPVEQVAQVIATYATDTAALKSIKEFVPDAANRYRIEAVVEKYLSIFKRDILRVH